MRETIFNIQEHDMRYREIVATKTPSQQLQDDTDKNNTTSDTNTITSFTSVMHNKPNPLSQR